MIAGPWINGAAVLAGALAGAWLGTRLPERLRVSMPPVLGLASMGLGISQIVRVSHLGAVMLALILGTLIGELVHLERGIARLASHARGLADRLVPQAGRGQSHEVFIEQFVALIVLFCASGTGIIGAMTEGMTGDASILVAKAVLDLFTSTIFATTLGVAVAIIALPQVAVQLLLAWGAALLLPLATPPMLGDFASVGGLLMLATGLRLAGIKRFPVASMLPALVLVFPLSAAWSRFYG